jgi:CBS domain-containing protein
MTTIHQLLQQKGFAIWIIAPEQTVFEALSLLAEKNIGALPVVDDGRVVGIFSERDYARKVVLRGLASQNTPVADVMTGDVVFINLQETVQDCMARMTDKRIRHLPVLNDAGALVGIISIGDVVKSVIMEQKALIGHLEAYITGGA